MREGLAAGVIVAGLLLAGCSSGATPDSPDGAAPKKSLPTSEPCAVLTDEQLKTLVLDQEPKQAERDGKQGCEFRSGAPDAPGWSVFVAADATGTYQQFVDANQGAQELPIAGYSSALVNDETGCHVAMDVAEAGSLKLTALVGPGAPIEVGGSCDAAAKVAEAVVQTLPSA